MSMHTEDQRLLIHFFQDSLYGAALKWYMGLDSTHICTFHDLGKAFIRQYKYNIDMAPDRDQLRAMSQREKESFKEYAQRWHELAAQIIPLMEEKEMTKVFLKTLSTFYYEKMVAKAPNDFTEMVNMGMQLKEGIREGRLVKEASSSLASGGVKRFGSNFAKKKEETVSAISRGRKRRYQIAAMTPVVSQDPPQNKNLVQLRDPPPSSANPPFWYKEDARCAFHKSAPGHTVENCYPLISEVLIPVMNTYMIDTSGCALVKARIQSLMDRGLIQILRDRDENNVNMIGECSTVKYVPDVCTVHGPLRMIHEKWVQNGLIDFSHDSCPACKGSTRGCAYLQEDILTLIGMSLLDEEIKERKGHNYVEEEMTYGPLDSMMREIPQRISKHNRDLYISAKYKDNTSTDVLVDAGSSLNIMPWSTLESLFYQGAPFRPNGVSVLTFEGFSCTMIGEIDLPIRIGPHDFDITFQVMEIYPAYNCLLGRPWIHNA
ncbi:uncharacterized protein LOC131604613 [Vicia villosa]|uniref:uncharacterized protein LOC131604613 n=1 Tax=Vicia villosa TaxID=3911 RepID=UPI00273AB732|nr:uncharacterized protein LOC131604613 [Vicia villosa]